MTSEADEDEEWRAALPADAGAFVAGIASRLGLDTPSPENDDFVPDPAAADGTFERVPIRWFMKRRLMNALLRDVHHYLFNATSKPRSGTSFAVQTEIRRRFVQALSNDGSANATGPHLVVSHSMGSVIAYDCLKRVADCPPVDGLITIGSPLGLDEIQDRLRPEWSRTEGFPSARLRGNWVNVYDRLDPAAALDPILANDYQKAGNHKIEDVNEQNHGLWRHSITKYLAGAQLRGALARNLRVTWP